VTAALTVTFGLPKIAHVTQPAAERCGKIAVADIGIPPAFAADIAPRTELLDSGCLARLRSARRPGSHKGNYGHLLIVAGSPGKLGAAMLAARAALTMGTGLVTVGLPASLNVAFEASVTEAMSLPLPETADGCLAERAADRIEEFLARVTALALGPGLSTAPESVRVVHRLVANRIRPVVIDADGLNALQAAPELLTPNSAAEPMVLTPHPGEMSRLTGMTTADIQNQRLDCARQFAAQRGAHLVLKGAGTVIAAPDGRAFINPTGNPGMATGGSGDVLTGIIGSLLAQAMPLPEAACAAVYLHGAAADLAVADRPMWNLTAGEIVAHLGQAALRLPTDQPSPWLTFLNG